MSKKGMTKILKNVRRSLSKHSPEILTGIGITGMLTTTVLAVKATPKALQLIDEMELNKIENDESIKKVDYIKAAWKPYIPAIVTGVASTACLIGASRSNLKRNAALVTAYKISETALNEYKEKVIEVVGEKKEQKIREEVSKERLKKDPVKTTEIIMTQRGQTRFYDSMGKRRFESDIETLRKIANDLNLRMRDEMYISLNEFYNEIGLDSTPAGDIIGWNIDKGYIDLRFDTLLDEDGIPCIVVDFDIRPNYGYNDIY